jgi:hypothetical protein
VGALMAASLPVVESVEADRITDFREMLPWHDSPGHNPLLC